MMYNVYVKEMMKLIRIYTAPSCASCRKVKGWLKEHQIPYVEKNIFSTLLRESELKELLERSENGYFTTNNSVTLDKLLISDISDFLISPVDVFNNFDKLEINSIERKHLLDGKKIERNVTNTSFILNNNEIVGIAKPNDYLKLDTYLGD